jgi:DNA/RNA endonuclease G (NUC1)
MRFNVIRGATLAAACALLVSCADKVNSPMPQAVGSKGTMDVAPGAKVVISQVYGGGGNGSAPYQNDFVELFNAGVAAQSLTGWSVQYASATGTGNFAATPLSGSIEPGQYYLVKLATNGAVGIVLPGFDASGTTNMSGTVGKVALSDQATTLGCNGGSNPCTAAQLAHLIDLVGYGTGASGANFFEGSQAPTLSNTTAGFRRDHGCTDTNDNAADFITGAPAPRFGETPKAPCQAVLGSFADVAISGAANISSGGTVVLSATLQDDNGNAIADPAATYTWTSSNEQIASIQSTSGNTATILGGTPGSATISVEATSNGVSKVSTHPASISVTAGPVIVPSTTFVSEIHSDNVGTDADERIEIEGNAGASLDGWELVLYDGNGAKLYTTNSTFPLSGIIPSNCDNGRGVVVLSFPVNGLQNGSPDGWALVNAQNQVTEFRSYEGTMTATEGPAVNLTSTAIDADETIAPPAGRSVQRAGNGVWFGPRQNTFGACNAPLPPPPEKLILRDGKDLLALGMQTQWFFDDNSGTGVTSVVWSTSDATVFSVDARGIVTGKKLGKATLTATASTDETIIGTVEIEIYLAPGSSGIRLGHNEEFGEPLDADPADDFIIHRPQYTVSYNRFRGGANWVSWNLSASHLGGSGRCSGTCYSADTALANAGIPAYTTADWVSNVGGVEGYDRGHMAPSADWTASEADNNTTFFLTNFLPQRADLNQGPWEVLEEALRDSVGAGREVYIIAGGIFTNGNGLGSLLGKGQIFIPDSTYKIAVIVPAGAGIGAGGTLPPNTTVLAVNMPNVQGIRAVPWENYRTTVGKIERSTGYDFLDLLSEPTECLAEGRNCAPTARISGASFSTSEGQALTFSGATSSDPNPGDVLTKAWFVNGAPSGSGDSFSYTFTNDGSYEVKLIVTDNQGSNSTAVATVAVSNVAPVVDAFGGATILVGESYAASGSFTDPGSDAWTATVSYGEGAPSSLGLAGHSFQLSHVYAQAGTFTVSVSVSDGVATGARTATVVVKSAAEGIADLDAAVLALGLSKGQANSLQTKLANAASQMSAGKTPAANNMLQAFINEVAALAESGRITEGSAAQLTSLAQRLAAARRDRV